MNPDKVGRIPPPTRKLVVRKANSHRDVRPLTEWVRKFSVDSVRSTIVVCNARCSWVKENAAFS